MNHVGVVRAGPLTTVQDGGRIGWAHLGVPRAGPLDAPAAARANRLVGNDPDAALLETTMGGTTLRVSVALAVAVTGAPCAVSVNGRPVPWGEAVSVPAGALVDVGSAVEGVRSYLALSGGLAVDLVLGSRSTDTLAYVGPPILAEGQVLPLGPRVGAPHDAPPVARTSQEVVLRYRPGPRDDWVTALPRGAYVVQPASNRVGLRLAGPRVTRRLRGELPSEGLVLGAVQVPADGQPLVFLNDHPTTGGYPVVGVVFPEDLSQCAQLRPGAVARLRPVARPAVRGTTA